MRVTGADPGPGAIVTVEALVRRYGPVTAVGGVSFEVRRGEMFGLIGPDGAGKTTTLRTILGLAAPDAGRVRTGGLDPFADSRRVARKIGYLSQRFSLYGDLSVDENIAFFAEVHGVRRWRPRRDELLELLRLAPFRRRLADRLSGGMKQKLALAATLVHTPELLVLDEPTTGVDPVSRREFWKILAELQRGGLTILVTTPYLDEAERCRRVALMDHGRLLMMDDPAALRANCGLALLEVVATPRDAVRAVLAQRTEIVGLQIFGERVHAELAPGTDASAGATAVRAALEQSGCRVSAVRPVPPSLEDVFISSIRAAAHDAPAGEAA
jgi:ABC-2 type transport system ATP-binding protein